MDENRSRHQGFDSRRSSRELTEFHPIKDAVPSFTSAARRPISVSQASSAATSGPPSRLAASSAASHARSASGRPISVSRSLRAASVTPECYQRADATAPAALPVAAPRLRRLRQRTAALRRRISAMDFACSGTLHTRTKSCGQAACRCATDPTARHGPYHEWSRRKDGRLVHSTLDPAQLLLVQRAIANRREIERLLALWEDESTREILRPKPQTP